MTKIIIDDIEYDSEDLSDDAKAQLRSLQFVTGEIERLQMKSAALQTARLSYSQALKQQLGGAPVEALDETGDTIEPDGLDE